MNARPGGGLHAWRWLGALTAAAAFAACSGGGAPAALPREGCEPRAAPGGGTRVADPGGPYGHQVVMARTADGVTLSGAHQVLDHASVPDGVRRTDGTVFLYYVNGETGGIHAARVSGDAVTALGAISIDGAAAPVGAVDPDAAPVGGGRIRLFYLGNLGPPQPDAGHPWYICAAESRDGVSFRLLGRAIQFDGETTTDPSVTMLKDGSWLMAASQGRRTVLARSRDGLRFAQFGAIDYGGVPEVAALPDGGVRLYVCARGIEAYISRNAGVTWAKEAADIAPALGHRIVCDPSYVPQSGLFFYKTGDAAGAPPAGR